ncbi:MEDS domain-containing protein [Actinoplanes siamensis]|uniref:MEDS domain-containing protein n=1 Tax=Actinoplanes siamensis TaxID=1223317 RepID=A0A919N6C4_9ACTN|nr:MEDS domain-containing protein [Actinoplanes siamensis]GIF05186.1 hypothetical protein Asi03nite_27240 [Actinoplanes siamensis]
MTRVAEARHTCWAYDDHRPFDAYARDFLGAGLAAGERVWYVPGDWTGTTAAWLRGAGPAGAARVISQADAYRGVAVVDPAGQVAAYAAATEDALAAGFTGFRVVAEATALVRSDAQRHAFATYEYVIGRYMRTAPMRAVCGYDRSELGDRAVAELACLHEASHEAGVTFQLHSGARAGESVLTGELDLAMREVFASALVHTDLATAGGEVVVDARELRFIDHQSLIALQRHLEARRLTAVVRTRLGATARLAGLLELPRVRVAVTG